MEAYYQNELVTIYHGDCLDILPELPKVDLAIADPPYNISKDTWDNITNYEDWMRVVFKAVESSIKDNGSFYWFHSEMPYIARAMTSLQEQSSFIFRQFIVWNKRFDGSPRKGYLDGYCVMEDLRNYQQLAEYILFYTFQDETGLTKIMGNCVYPIRDYIRGEIEKAKGKIVLKDINAMLGTATNGGGVASACLSVDKTCPAMITEEHYLKLRDWLNGKEYKYLRKEYEDLRFTFNNKGTHHSVWNYDFVGKQGHITPKPVNLICNIMEYSMQDSGTVLDPFLGSGTTAVAAMLLKRRCVGVEIEERYCEIAAKRCEQAKTGLTPAEQEAGQLTLFGE